MKDCKIEIKNRKSYRYVYSIVLQSLKIQMSAQTTPNKLVNQITGNLMKKNANLLGCPPGKWLLVFIDDLNIPQIDSFGDQPTLETLRYILQTGFYSLPTKKKSRTSS